MNNNLSTLLRFRKAHFVAKKNLFTVVLFTLLVQAVALSQTTISITPSVSNVAVGQTFAVRVRADIASGSLNAIEAFINFDRSLLQVQQITKLASSVFTFETIPLPADYDAANGTGPGSGEIGYGAGIPVNTQSASFDFYEVTFIATQAGTANLVMNTTFPRITRAVLGGTVVTGAPVDAVVNITAACTDANATLTAGSTCGGGPFSLTLQSATGVSPYDLVINGNIYNDLIVGSTIPITTNESLWTIADEPAIPDQNDGGEIEVGTKFVASVAGYVKGVRFYKGPLSAGTFVGKLYDFATQAELARATFVTTPSGWQEVLFSSPVTITAGTTYVVTCYSPDGYYAGTDNYFGTARVSGSLTAPAGDGSTDITSNGVYRFGSEGFPAGSFENSSYFVDVVFAPSQYTFNLTSVSDDAGCTNTGALQTLVVSSPDCSTLPVTLLNFSASPNGNKITLRWATSTELNNKGFDVQRSLDGIHNWQTLGFVNGAGNSTSTQNYSFVDGDLSARRYFYQLKQIDIDNNYKYSMVVSALISGKEGFSLEQNFPNPARNQSTTIRFTLPRKTNVVLAVYDMNGRLAKTLVSGSKDAGTHAIPFDPSSLSAGIYYYKIQADGFIDSKKMTIQ